MTMLAPPTRQTIRALAACSMLAPVFAAADDETEALKNQLATAQARIAELEAAAGISIDPALQGLDSPHPATGRQAIALWREKGTAALPQLREIAFESASATARHRAKEALGGITGQWGSHTDLVWKRSVAEAINEDKPLLVLQLFGSLDEEFC